MKSKKGPAKKTKRKTKALSPAIYTAYGFVDRTDPALKRKLGL
jgi:hypothetical protein